MYKKLLAFAFVCFVAYWVHFAVGGFPVLTGFTAKIVCSNHFIAGRDIHDVLREDVLSPFARLVRIREEQPNSVTACVKIFGIDVVCQTAFYTPGIGCTRGSRPDFDTSLVVQPTESSPETHWPKGDVPNPSQINADLQKYLESIIKANTFGNTTKQIVVVHNGVIVGEAYDKRYPAMMPQLGWSMTKSVTNAFIGLLVQKGKVSVDEKVYPGRNITVDNLLRMNSGIRMDEDYTRASDATNMLFRERDFAAFYDTLPIEAEPGAKWSYSSGSTNKLAKIVKERVGGTLNDYYKFVKTELFNKIGMKSAVIESDESGNFVGSSYMFATARDWARFGLLFLNNGKWNNEQILPSQWSAYSAAPTKHSFDGWFEEQPKNGGDVQREHSHGYGAQFWLRSDAPFPIGTYFCMGFAGQSLTIVPQHNLVMVKLSLKREATEREERFNDNVYTTLKSILQLP